MKKQQQFFVWGEYEDRQLTMDCVIALEADAAENIVTGVRDCGGGWHFHDCKEAWSHVKHLAQLASTDSDIVREEWEITKKNLA